MDLTTDRFTGCLLGLAMGDALGAPHEGGSLERLVWKVMGRTRDGRLRWTDDTQMALDLAESLLEENGVRRGEVWEAASRSAYPDGSYGNGAAVRAALPSLKIEGRDQIVDVASRLSRRQGGQCNAAGRG